jgi:glycosyltransferase involved in cell wall biosynthesis
MRISVVIPAYNRENLILPTLESVRQQSLPAVEVLVVDDCSKDGTMQVMEEYAAGHPDFPLRLIRQERNQGVSAARNRGIREASGEWIAFLDSDDMWESDHLAGLASQAQASGAEVVFSRVRGFSDTEPDAASKTWTSRFQNTQEVLAEMVAACHILPSAAMVRRETLLAHGCFDETPAIQHAEDWDLWLRMIAAETPFALTDQFTCLYRQHEGSACRDKSRLYRAIVHCLKKNQGSRAGSAKAWRTALGYYEAKLGRALFAAGQPGAASLLFSAWRREVSAWPRLVAACLCVVSAVLPFLRPLARRFNQRFL